MPISRARSFRHRTARPAFTLVELMIVMALLAIVMFLVVPAFQNLLEGSLHQETNRLAGVIRLLRNEAILGRTTYRLMLAMEDGRYFVEQRNADGEFVERTDPPMLRAHQLPESFELKQVLMFGEPVRHRKDEPVPIVVDPSGFVDPFLLQFQEGDQEYTFKVTGFTGKVELVQGHVSE